MTDFLLAFALFFMPAAILFALKSKPNKEDKKDTGYEDGTNWVEGGIDKSPLLYLVFAAPFICQVLAFVTSDRMTELPTLTGAFNALIADPSSFAKNASSAVFSGRPTMSSLVFLGVFNLVALVLEILLPGKTQYGPETHTGHVPKYIDNGFLHCMVYTSLFVGCSNFGLGLYDFGVMFDEFLPCLTALNIFGFLFAFFLYFKGLHFPSTKDSGSSGGFMVDFLWGTELYPRVGGVDLKRFINSRFSMTYWQLAGLSFAYRSYTTHGTIDYGLLLSAISQYVYLVKFFWWEMGYMRSIDIIVDRAGFEIQWGCLVWVPAVYTFHSRFLVLHPSGLGLLTASTIFAIGLAGVALNFAADNERQKFRERDGKMKVWGKDPTFVTAQYTIVDSKTGVKENRTSLLLASGFWGVARHFHYVFELMAAWSWCLLANPVANGVAPLFYCVFLTTLLIQRAKRDEEKCSKKYGKYYDEYSRIVPYLIIPGVY